MKNLYNKIAPVISKIALVGLIVAFVGLLGSKVYVSGLDQTQVWELYYAAWVDMISTYLLIGFAVLYVLFSLPTLWPALKEAVRKFVVSLKRNPSVIPLAVMFITFLYYSLNMTDLSDTTAKVYGKGMGLCQFCIMLFSLLSLVCMLNAFPRRKKANVPMIVLMFVMFGIILYCDFHYSSMIAAAITRPENPIAITKDTEYIVNAYNMLNVHMILIIVSAAMVALLPLYSRLLKLIKTSVVIEDNGDMAKIEIQD